MRIQPRFPQVLRSVLGAVALGTFLVQVQPACAQGTGGLVVSDSKVGYIDTALLGSIFRPALRRRLRQPPPQPVGVLLRPNRAGRTGFAEARAERRLPGHLGLPGVPVVPAVLNLLGCADPVPQPRGERQRRGPGGPQRRLAFRGPSGRSPGVDAAIPDLRPHGRRRPRPGHQPRQPGAGALYYRASATASRWKASCVTGCP